MLVIEDIDTPTRPKSFTVAATDAPRIEFKDVGIPGEESNLLRLGDTNKVPNAHQKRQEFRTAKSAPQSLEFVVKKPTPKVQEPPPSLQVTRAEHDKELDHIPGENEDQLSFNLLEVPSRFKNFSAHGSEEDIDTTDNIGNQLIASSSDTLTEDIVGRLEDGNLLTEESTTDPVVSEDIEDSAFQAEEPLTSEQLLQQTEADVQKALDIVKEMTVDKEDCTNKQTMESETTDANSNIPETSSSVPSDNQKIDSNGNNEINDNRTSMENNIVQHMTTDEVDSHSYKPVPAERHSLNRQGKTSSRNEKSSHMSPLTAAEVAFPDKKGDMPQLLSYKRRVSTKLDDQETDRHSSESYSDKQKLQGQPSIDSQNEENYKVEIIGGVAQKIPIDSMGSPVRRRPQGKRKAVDRRVSCKDLGEGDCQGFLYKGKGRGDGILTRHWIKRWVVLKHNNLFYFKDKEDLKAEGVIHLPAFRVSPATDVKTKKFAFRVHNTGTSFLFASQSQMDMAKWMNKMQINTLNIELPDSESSHLGGFNIPSPRLPPHHDQNFSESEDEGEDVKSESPDSGSIAEAASIPTDHNSGETEDLCVILRSIKDGELTIDGHDKHVKRRATLNATEENDMPSAEQIRMKKLHSLKRTLKAKEKELEDIEKLLTKGPTASDLRQFEDIYSKSSPSDSESEAND